MDECQGPSYNPAHSHAAVKGSAAESRMNSPPPDLSIIIPVFNEEHRLPQTLERISAFLSAHSMRGEIIVVDDGSSDGTPAVTARSRAQMPDLRVVRHERNHGKGFSVRQGMLQARADIALFTDADLSTPIEEADKLIAAIQRDGYDGAIGSRAIDRTLIQVHQSAVREWAGILFNRAVRWIAGIRYSDTQCGFKAFRLSRARILFEQQRIEGFGFDAEILFLAKRQGLRVAEIPVRWSHDSATKVRVAADGMRMVLDLLRIRGRAWMGLYQPAKPLLAQTPVPQSKRERSG